MNRRDEMKMNRKFLSNLMIVVALTILGYFLVRRVQEGFAAPPTEIFFKPTEASKTIAKNALPAGQTISSVNFQVWDGKAWKNSTPTYGANTQIVFRKPDNTLFNSARGVTGTPPVGVNTDTLPASMRITNAQAASNLTGFTKQTDPSGNLVKMTINYA